MVTMILGLDEYKSIGTDVTLQSEPVLIQRSATGNCNHSRISGVIEIQATKQLKCHVRGKRNSTIHESRLQRNTVVPANDKFT